jgi:S-adenosylmethionine-dependent methyltransferase
MVSQDATDRFSAGADAWAGYNQQPLGRIRQEVTWRNLVRHLPDLVDDGEPPRVLDAGGGSGELALRLARDGYRVWLLDYAPGMLDQARHAALALPDEAQARVTFCLLPVSEASGAFAPGFFQVVTCHTLVEYLKQPQATIGELARLLCAGGLLSLSFVNRHAEVLRQVWSQGDPTGALERLEDGSFCAGLFGVSGQAYTSEEVSAWLPPMGLNLTATYGVRAFADQVPEGRLADTAFLDTLVQLETAAAQLDPYRRIARYVHLLARKDVELS